MEIDSTALVRSGAAAVVGLMATDRWGAAKERVASLLGHGAQVESRLERERRVVVTAHDHGDSAAIADLELVWRTRLRRVLAGDRFAAAALRELTGAAEESPG